jgi:8-amino-7-oxononanoate synthase
VLENAAYLHEGLRQLGYRLVEPSKLPDGREVITPIVAVVVGEDWQTALLWKALWDRGVYTNVALYPAVPRSGSLIRTSVMATHEREHLDRALEIFAAARDGLPPPFGE